MVQTLNEAIQEDLRGSKLPARRIAEELDMSYSMLMNACNPDLPEFQMPARKLVRFIQLTGGCHVVKFILSSIGMTAIKLPSAGDVSGKSCHQSISESVAHFGELLADAGNAVADKRIDWKEAKQLQKDIATLQQKLAELHDVVELAHNGQAEV